MIKAAGSAMAEEFSKLLIVRCLMSSKVWGGPEPIYTISLPSLMQDVCTKINSLSFQLNTFQLSTGRGLEAWLLISSSQVFISLESQLTIVFVLCSSCLLKMRQRKCSLKSRKAITALRIS